MRLSGDPDINHSSVAKCLMLVFDGLAMSDMSQQEVFFSSI